MNWLHDKKDFPKDAHYAIIEFGSISQAGYDSNDPGDLVPHNEYIFFTDKLEWEKEISIRTLNTSYGRKEFVAFKSVPVTIETDVRVKIKE